MEAARTLLQASLELKHALYTNVYWFIYNKEEEKKEAAGGRKMKEEKEGEIWKRKKEQKEEVEKKEACENITVTSQCSFIYQRSAFITVK